MNSIPQNSEKPPGEKTAEKNSAPQFTIWQINLAVDLGISEEELRRRRDKFLTEGIHFKKEGTRKLYSKEGEAKLRETLCIALAEPPQKNAPPSADEQKPQGAVTTEENGGSKSIGLLTQGAAEITLKIWRSSPVILNKHIVEAYQPALDPHERKNIVNVRVKDNATFRPGMFLKARLINPPSLYEFIPRTLMRVLPEEKPQT